MTLTEQVEAALTDEVMDAAALEGWTESTAEMRRRILSPLAPVLAQQEATVTTLTAERDRARQIASDTALTLSSACQVDYFVDPNDAKEIASWPTK